MILRDQYIDELETELDRLCLEFLVRQQPVAGHLRFVFTAIQINQELERIGDYAESIARQVLAVSTLEPQPPYAMFVELGESVGPTCCGTPSSPSCKGCRSGARTMVIEERANTLRNSINAELAELSRKSQLPGGGPDPADDHRAALRARVRPGQEPLRGSALHVHRRVRQAQGGGGLPHPVPRLRQRAA